MLAPTAERRGRHPRFPRYSLARFRRQTARIQASSGKAEDFDHTFEIGKRRLVGHCGGEAAAGQLLGVPLVPAGLGQRGDLIGPPAGHALPHVDHFEVRGRGLVVLA